MIAFSVNWSFPSVLLHERKKFKVSNKLYPFRTQAHSSNTVRSLGQEIISRIFPLSTFFFLLKLCFSSLTLYDLVLKCTMTKPDMFSLYHFKILLVKSLETSED